MKEKKVYLLTLIMASLLGCSYSKTSNSSKNVDRTLDFTLISPTGAPTAAFLNYLNNDNYDTNTVPNNIVAEMLKGTYDIVVVDLIGGLTAIEKKSAEYKLASIITFGNFYIYSTGNDENGIMEESDNVICFGQNNTPDILFNHLYPDIGVDTYLAGVSDIAPIAISGKLNDELVDYCIIAEPVLYNVINNSNAPTYGKGSKYSDFQSKWKEKYGENSSILGASIYIKNSVYESNTLEINHFLNQISSDIDEFIDNPSKAKKILDEYGTKEKQAQKIGINSNIIEGVLKDNNSINLGFKSSSDNDFETLINQYLNIVNPSLINSDNYIK